ncbi:MAG: hypothetical protein GX129_04515 [Clostridiales bacterium]|jgi:hypothetical protein|nr:hypothetical protein [Clostridiales bacterium]
MKYRNVIKIIAIFILIALAWFPNRTKAANSDKGYLLIFEDKDGTYNTFDNLVYETSDNELLVKAKPTAKALGLKYQNGNGTKKGCKISLGNKQLAFTRNSKTYYYSTTTSNKKKTANYKQSFIASTNMIHYSTLSTFYGCSYFNTEKVQGYYSNGYKGVIVYSAKQKTPTLPNSDIMFGIKVKASSYQHNYESYKPQVIKASVSIVSGADKLKLDLSNVLETYRKNKLPSDGVYGYGSCDENITIEGVNNKGEVVGKSNIRERNFMVDFPGAQTLIISGKIKNLHIGFTPEKPIVITDTITHDPKDIDWLSADGCSRKYFVLPPYTVFNFYNWITQVAYTHDYKILGNNMEPNDFNSAYQLLSVIFFTSPETFITGEGFGIQFKIWEKTIDNPKLLVYDSYSNSQSYNYESELNRIMDGLKNAGLYKYFNKNIFDSKVIIKVQDGVPTGGNRGVTVEPEYTDLDGPYDYYVHFHELTHFYEGQLYHYGFSIQAWTEGNSLTLSEKVMKSMNINTDDIYAFRRNVVPLIERNKQNFEDYYLTVSGDESYIIGYYFTKYLNETYGDDTVYRILENVYKKNIPTNVAQSSILDKQFADCIKAATSEDVFDRFVKEYQSN